MEEENSEPKEETVKLTEEEKEKFAAAMKAETEARYAKEAEIGERVQKFVETLVDEGTSQFTDRELIEELVFYFMKVGGNILQHQQMILMALSSEGQEDLGAMAKLNREQKRKLWRDKAAAKNKGKK